MRLADHEDIRRRRFAYCVVGARSYLVEPHECLHGCDQIGCDRDLCVLRLNLNFPHDWTLVTKTPAAYPAQTMLAQLAYLATP